MNNKNTLGVVIGRFQLSNLHIGHRYLIDTVLQKHERVLVLIGTRVAQPTERDPLDYETRRSMLEKQYPSVIIRPLYDTISNHKWSNDVDVSIENAFPGCVAVLYGSRDSFIPHYHGRFKCSQVSVVPSESATELRENGACTVLDSEAFRAGVIYSATQQRFPTAYQVVDVAVLHTTKPEILLGRKSGEKSWRFFGGFVDPSDESLERAAKREVLEESGDIEVDDFRYVGSRKINDRRYQGTRDGMMTAFFVASYIFGAPCANDDICEVRWQNLSGFIGCLVSDHKELGRMLENYLQSKS